MPFFLIPIVVGVYMYFENKRKKEAAGGQDKHVNVKIRETSEHNNKDGVSSDCDGSCSPVIEAQLSPHSSSSSLGGGVCPPIVKVTFEQRMVPDRQESEVSTSDDDGDDSIVKDGYSSKNHSSPRDSPWNEMNHTHRQRLARTARELSKFLGEQPFVLCGS